MSKLIHRGCGGEFVEDWSKTYEYEHDDGTLEIVPSYICSRCGEEGIGGIDMIIMDDNGNVVEDMVEEYQRTIALFQEDKGEGERDE